MLKMILFLTIGALMTPLRIALPDESYQWPLKLVPELTSRFCDYRSGHFHAGLDIRTNGRTGFKIYAPEDCFVFRVTMSYRGYGKALYLKLTDGRIAVFGHLLGFGKDVDDRIWKAQMGDKRYRQDLYFKAGEFPVKKGELIGYSGSSGSGAPHLHLELRSANNNPLNPLKFGFPLREDAAPVFSMLAVRNYSNGFDPAAPCDIEFPNIGKTSDLYVVRDTIVSDGYVALAVSGGDKTDKQGFLYGFYSLKLLVDDSLVFSSISDSITYEGTNQQEYIRDMALSRMVGSKKTDDNDEDIFFRLYIPQGVKQFFWARESEGSGIIPPGKEAGQVREFEIVAGDESGNESRLQGYILTPNLKAPEPGFISYYRFGNTIEADFMTFEKIDGCRIQYKNLRGQDFENVRCSLTSKTWDVGEDIAFLNTVTFPAPGKSGEYRFGFYDGEGKTSPWIYFSDAPDKNGFRLHGSPGYLRIEYVPDLIIISPYIEITNEGQTYGGEMYPSGIRSYYYDIIGRNFSGETEVLISKDQTILIDTSIVLHPVRRGQKSSICSLDSSLVVIFDEKSAYYSAYVYPAIKIEDKTQGNYKIKYDIQPDDLIADKPITFRFDLSRLNLVGKKMGMYGQGSDRDKWRFIGTGGDSILTVNGFGLGTVALIEDTLPPNITSVKPSGRIRTGEPLLSCVISDGASGLDLDGFPNIWIDGVWVPAEFDIGGGKFYYQVRNRLERGKHRLEIEALDNQGNRQFSKTFFTVTSGK